MPQAAIAQVFVTLGASAAGAAAAAALVQTILINVALGAISKALGPRAARQEAPPVNVTIRSTVENRRLIFGTVRAAGAFLFYGATGENNKFLYYVVAVAGHQVSAIKDVWLDKVRILPGHIDGSGNVIDGFFSGKVLILKHLGTQAQTVDTTLQAAFSQWTSDHRLRSVAHIIIRMERDEAAFPQGAPQDVTAITDGALLYDARLDSTNGGSGSHRRDDPSTWAFSRNPTLATRWFLTGGSVVNDQASRQIMYGLRESDARILDSYTLASANICDEQLTGANTTPDGDQTRYTCDLEVSTGETRREILDAILATMAGTAVEVHGQWRIYAGAYDAPTHTLTQDDLYGTIDVEDTSGHKDRYNAVAAVYRDAANNWIEATTPFRTNSTYETQDNEERIPVEIDLRGVTDKYRAQRLCEIHLRKSRLMRMVNLVGALNLLKVAQNETASMSHTRFGWVGYVFRCLERQFEFNEEAGRVSLTCRAEASSVYTDMLTADYITPNEVVPIHTVEIPEPPSGLQTVPQQNGILVKWSRSTTPGVTYRMQQSTSSSMSSPTEPYLGTDTQAYIDQTGTSTYYFRIRAERAGQVSAWVPGSGGTSGAAAGVTVAFTATVYPGTASSSSTSASQTTGSVTVTPNGGTAPYTYAWTWLSGGTSITIDSASAATTTFSAATLADPETRSGIARCTITDNASATYTVDVSVSIVRTPSFSASAVGTVPLNKTANSTAMTSNSITASPSGGTAPFTYLWSIVTHDDPNSTPTINSSTSSVCTVTTNDSPSAQRTISVTVECQVTDNIARVVTTNTVTISHTHDNGA